MNGDKNHSLSEVNGIQCAKYGVKIPSEILQLDFWRISWLLPTILMHKIKKKRDDWKKQIPHPIFTVMQWENNKHSNDEDDDDDDETDNMGKLSKNKTWKCKQLVQF